MDQATKTQATMNQEITRRQALGLAPAAGLALSTAATVFAAGEKPALLGGPKARKDPFPKWPRFDALEEKNLLEALRSGKWNRGQAVKSFEEAYAKLTGAKEVLATCNGTSSLIIAMKVLGVEPGDEVIVPPYTFIATINAVLMQYALPVFVDSDPETFQVDAKKIEGAITPATRALLPVHLGGNVCDMDAIPAIAKKHQILLVEDACQAHIAEWRGKKVGTFGDAGCFSFQATKNLNSGEGGAITFNDSDLRERAYAFHNSGSGLRNTGASFTYASASANMRITEFQAAILLGQMSRLAEQARIRMANGTYLASMLRQIKGIQPARQYDGCTNNAYHLFMFRYDPLAFSGLTRDQFLKALAAEGIPASRGYTPLNTQDFLKKTLASRGYLRIYGEKRLQQWAEQNHCPANDKLCTEAVWFTQNLMLSERTAMDQIVEAIRKIQNFGRELAQA